MEITIEKKVFEHYPEAQIGFLTAQVELCSDGYLEEFKKQLPDHLTNQGINATNFVAQPLIAIWRKIYQEDFGVNPKSYRSSIEALVRRVVTGKEIWKIHPVVDLYNCCSVLTLLPMGGYDIDKLSGNLMIRYAEEGEKFLPLGEGKPIETSPHHLVYADEARILCWLWNHKDSAESCIDLKTKRVLFFVDSFDLRQVENALDLLAEKLPQIDSLPLERGILNQTHQRSKIFAVGH